MTSTARKIEKKYIPMPTWELTPQALTELCERAGTSVLREALKMARRRGEPAVIAVIFEHFRESVEDDPLPGDFWRRTWEKFCGLAY